MQTRGLFKVDATRYATVNDSTCISWESVYKISRSWVDVLIFAPFYMKSCIWPDGDFVMDSKKEQHYFLCKSLKKCDENPGSG
jgi:hypothetical protein